MDIGALAGQVFAFLSPFIPMLVGGVVTKVGEEIGSGAVERAKTIWEKIHPKLEANDVAKASMQDFANNPNDPDAQAALRRQITLLLSNDSQFAQEISNLMTDSVVQTVLAERGSEITDVEQISGAGGKVQQDITARGDSTIKGVKQQRN